MNEKIVTYKNKSIEFWQGRTKRQRGLLVTTILLILLVFLAFMWFGSRTNYVPLYSNLTVQETGEIKNTLDARGVPSEVSSDGTSILVPEAQVNELKVSLAAEGLPNSGRIDYSTFSENMGFGTTDNTFNLLERAALQTSIEDLIRNIDGVRNAQVMITLPEESVWLSDDREAATASVLLNLDHGYSLDQNQVRALYHLVSRSIPNLPVENIVMMDQMSRYLELDDQTTTVDSSLTIYEQQRQIQRDIERDLQRQVQQMLGTMVGTDKVLVTVSTDLDFTQENRQEQLVTPVNEEDMSGIAVSIERITETYTGQELADGGVAGTGETDIPGYPGVGNGGVGDYEKMEERINNDVNRIQREIVESPYKIRDIAIQVMLEPQVLEDATPEQLQQEQERVNAVQQMLGQIVRTSIDAEYTAQWEEEDIDSRIFVSSQQFFGKPDIPEPPSNIPFWYYIVGGLVLLILILIILLFRKGKPSEELDMMEVVEQSGNNEIEPIKEKDTEGNQRRKQLEKLAKDKPEEFSKLIRTWLSED
ncbi:flagellar basal-body MS-ring/collar protein FliF [Evansella cellulosilytica]|uniref:Flagellar M-ring protein n=1 Tax=Evansella cellulosilytica (strain ATCC 21833 / DSM 2522 / FERM P-1141 / JCM 9156 / N-4) TaxID=649639 RepID=E6TSW8_EVAC2|nr:flagellar basal-body MS-ring/collar protein FliF [Evansella cellulosilytica]ADU30760.1 flagellar M-ring protein FliF [Evansella cellulosilytica DSM 2522]